MAFRSPNSEMCNVVGLDAAYRRVVVVAPNIGDGNKFAGSGGPKLRTTSLITFTYRTKSTCRNAVLKNSNRVRRCGKPRQSDNM